MWPEEVEHTKEPAYDRDIYWPAVFQLQSNTNANPRSEASEVEDGNSIAGFLSSQNTTPPPEEEIQLEHYEVKGNEDAEADEPSPLLHNKPLSEEQTLSTGIPPPVDSRNGTSLVSSIESIKSGDFVAGVERLACEHQSPTSENSVHEEANVVISTAQTFESDEPATKSHEAGATVNSGNTGPIKSQRTAPEADLKLFVKPHSLKEASVSVVDAKDQQENAKLDTPKGKLASAISCPSTFSATDPPSTRLRHMIANSPSIILCPGVYDGLSARIALHVGFKGMYMTGAGTTASCLGASDLGIAHLHDMRTNAEMIANLQPDGPPLIADMDTGYGGPLIISRAVKQYARAGVAAFHIEDQVPEKRCGHLSGKEVVDTETYLQRIRACLDARAQIRSDIIIIARTDALQSRGYDECIERLRRARDLGADMGILEGVATKAAAAQAVKDLAPWPLCYNSVENGHSPLITAAEAQEMGYRVMIFSFAGIAPAYMAIMETFTKLKEEGVTGSIVGPKKIFEVCGLREEMRIDEAVGGKAFAKGV